MGEIPDDIKSIKLKVETDFDTMISNLENEIKKLDLPNKKKELSDKIKQNEVNLEPYLKKIAGQKELQKLTAQLESEKLKFQNALALESQFRNLLEEYNNIRKQKATLLNSRFETYKKIEQKVNDTKKNIGSDIELNSTLIYKLSNFQLFEQVNKAAIGTDHFFNSFITGDLVNYNPVPELYAKQLRVVDDKLLYGKDESIPLKVRTTFEDVLRGGV